MKENVIKEKSMDFAVRIVKLYQHLCDKKKEYILSKQLLRSGTSIGANVRESANGQSEKDFLSKLNIALKEADETAYWIELLYRCGYISNIEFDSIHSDSDEIIRLLTSIIKTMKKKLTNN